MSSIYPIRRNLITLPAEQVAFIEEWYAENIDNEHCVHIEELPLPKWHFLAYLCDHMGLLAHGSNLTELTTLIPVAKQRGDLTEFGNATQIFASPDALWAMWFAVLNRESKSIGTANSCVRHVDEAGAVYKSYWFSVPQENILEDRPVAEGMIYLVRPEPFRDKNGEEWGSKEEVVPLAKLAVVPDDWPFSEAVLGFERERLLQRIEESAELFPYFDDEQLWQVIPEVYKTETWIA